VKRSTQAYLGATSLILCAAAILATLAANAGAFARRDWSTLSAEPSPPFRIPADRMRLPNVMLWAWERPEDLRSRTGEPNPPYGVAFLACTIELQSLPPAPPVADRAPNLGVQLKPRLQPLRVDRGTPLMAVVRLETSNDLWHKPEQRGANSAAVPDAQPYSDAQRERVAELIADAAATSGVRGLQIDFDAAQSEHAFYAALLQDVRQRLPREIPLSITALASWCIGDPWLERLPPGTIDEAVPMLFRMGPDEADIAAFLRSGNEFRPSVCRGSLGISTDEPLSQAILAGQFKVGSQAAAEKRIYVFPAASLNQNSVADILGELKR
jgi:hypothetical protein